MTIKKNAARRKTKRISFVDDGDGFAYGKTPYGTAIIEAADLVRISELNWYWRPPKGAHSARIVGGRWGVDLGRFLIEPLPPGRVVDHINRNALDNRRSNLRSCTRQQNLQNTPGSSTRKSPFKGIYPSRGKWMAQIQRNGKRTRFGPFLSPVDAAKAYDAEAISLHGEFACTNASLGLV